MNDRPSTSPQHIPSPLDSDPMDSAQSIALKNSNLEIAKLRLFLQAATDYNALCNQNCVSVH